MTDHDDAPLAVPAVIGGVCSLTGVYSVTGGGDDPPSDRLSPMLPDAFQCAFRDGYGRGPHEEEDWPDEGLQENTEHSDPMSDDVPFNPALAMLDDRPAQLWPPLLPPEGSDEEDPPNAEPPSYSEVSDHDSEAGIRPPFSAGLPGMTQDGPLAEAADANPGDNAPPLSNAFTETPALAADALPASPDNSTALSDVLRETASPVAPALPGSSASPPPETAASPPPKYPGVWSPMPTDPASLSAEPGMRGDDEVRAPTARPPATGCEHSVSHLPPLQTSAALDGINEHNLAKFIESRVLPGPDRRIQLVQHRSVRK